MGTPEGTFRQFFLQFLDYRVLGTDLGYTVIETLVGFVILAAAALVVMPEPSRGQFIMILLAVAAIAISASAVVSYIVSRPPSSASSGQTR